MIKLSSMIDRGGIGVLLLVWTTASLGILSIAL